MEWFCLPSTISSVFFFYKNLNQLEHLLNIRLVIILLLLNCKWRSSVSVWKPSKELFYFAWSAWMQAWMLNVSFKFFTYLLLHTNFKFFFSQTDRLALSQLNFAHGRHHPAVFVRWCTYLHQGWWWSWDEPIAKRDNTNILYLASKRSAFRSSSNFG